MIDYTLHPNGWTVFANIDLNTATRQDLHDIATLCAKFTCVKVRNQNLTIEKEAEIVKSYKDPHLLYTPDHERFKHYALDKEGYICRVTGKLDADGVSGIAGHKEEMLWHHEQPAERGSSSIAWLYAVSGVNGSTTVWNNTIAAYADLDYETKEKIKDLKVIQFGNVNHAVTRTQENFNNRKVYEDHPVPLVITNTLGKTGLHLSLHQFERFDGMTREQSLEIAEPLFKFITQDKYCYYHEWKDGDVSWSDQWLGVHRRLQFNNMAERIVHRATFDYPENLL
jgi:alpha-ketoglutarate-dependent taurine dioxygenase